MVFFFFQNWHVSTFMFGRLNLKTEIVYLAKGKNEGVFYVYLFLAFSNEILNSLMGL